MSVGNSWSIKFLLLILFKNFLTYEYLFIVKGFIILPRVLTQIEGRMGCGGGGWW